jgi:hypothetical protein
MAASAITAWDVPAVILRPRRSAAHRPATSPPRQRMPVPTTIAAVAILGSPSTLSE